MLSDREEAMLNCQLILASILFQVEGLNLITMMLCLGNLVTSQIKQRHNNKRYTSQESRGGENNGWLAFCCLSERKRQVWGSKKSLCNMRLSKRKRRAPA
jgi:hypothetical protein